MTRRDDVGFRLGDLGGGTRRDGVGTRRDDVAAGGFVRVVLPPGLAGRFELVEVLPASGAEADVVLVADAVSGVRRVVKLYRSGIEPDRVALDALLDADRAHVVEVVEAGVDAGVFFEVLEWCEHGSLRDLVASGAAVSVHDVVDQMSAALNHVHGLGLVHRDLKPANVLVRNVAPLELVLADFGLVRAMDSSVRFTRAFGTTEYAPPELAAGEVSTAFDWWSLGMMAAELAGGRHPLALGDGSFPPHQQIVSELAQRPVDLGHLDDRTGLLCRGLLTRNRRHRWSSVQVNQWLAGGTPDVNDTADTGGTRRGRSVLFGGVEHDNLASLANSLQANWSEGRRRLFAERDGALIDEVERLCRDCNSADAATMLRSQIAAKEIPRRFASLLIELDPNLEPVYDGVTLTKAGLEQAALNVTQNNGEHRDSGVLNQIREHSILTVWRSLRGVDHGPGTQHTWDTYLNDLAALWASLPAAAGRNIKPNTAEGNLAAARLLLCALDNAHIEQLSTQSEQLDSALAGEQSWWKQLETAAPVQALTRLATHPIATEQTNQQHTEQEQQEAAAREADRVKQEHARAAEDLRRRRAQLQRQISFVQASGPDVNLKQWWFTLGAVAALLLLPGLIGEQGTYGRAWIIALVTSIGVWALGQVLIWSQSRDRRSRADRIAELDRELKQMRPR